MSGLPDDIPIMLQWWGSVIASAAKIRVSGLTVTDLPPYLAAIGVTGNSRFFGNNGFGNAGFWEIPEFLVFIYLSCHMSMGQFKSDHFSVSGLEKMGNKKECIVSYFVWITDGMFSRLRKNYKPSLNFCFIDQNNWSNKVYKTKHNLQ